MRWLGWNLVGCLLWIAGMVCVTGADVASAAPLIGGAPDAMVGLPVGAVGLALLVWFNLVEI